MERKWKKQSVSNISLTLPLKYPFYPHAHTLYLIKTMDKAAGTGKWVSRRKINDFHMSYLFHYLFCAILSLSNIHDHFETGLVMTSYFLYFIL